ncbi:MAG: disulfide bond formation protein B, partial [Sphingobium sp.]
MLALVVPALLLGGAYVSQYWGGLAPCEMCWWQRYGHMAAIPLALLAFFTRRHRDASALLTLLAGIAILS